MKKIPFLSIAQYPSLCSIITFLFMVACGSIPAAGAGDQANTSTKSYRGILKTGIVAIGGETTGVTLTTKNEGVFELDLGKNQELQRRAEELNGKNVVVVGDYKPREGVEVKLRRIILVKTLQLAK